MPDERPNRTSAFVVALAIMTLAAFEPVGQTVPAAQAQVPPPAPAQPPTRNPAVEAAVATVDKALADPSKKEALCAYVRAREGTGAAMSNYSAGTTGRNPITRERQQIDQLRALGSAQGAERQAAAAVDPEFYRAFESLRIGDFREAIRVDIALQRLCKAQQ